MDKLRLPALPTEVVVHPLVLLSVVDHYNRVAKDTKKRVVGVLLGEVYKGRVDATNCFAGGQGGPGTATCCAGGLGPGQQLLHTWPAPASDGWRTALAAHSAVQCPLRRTTRTPPFGSWTTATWRTCTACSKRSTVRRGVGPKSLALALAVLVQQAG